VHHSAVIQRLAVLLVIVSIVTPIRAAAGPSRRAKASPQSVYRINAGGPKIGSSVRWDGDTMQTPSPYISAEGVTPGSSPPQKQSK
jgi:hypothetical protein